MDKETKFALKILGFAIFFICIIVTMIFALQHIYIIHGFIELMIAICIYIII